MTSTSLEPLAPHRRIQMKNRKSDYPSLIPAQVVKRDAPRPGLDPVEVSKPESETSSIQIITDRRPSCWSIASPPETLPTEWNSAAAYIDRPVTTRLPVYRFPKPEHKTGRENAASPSNRQEAKPKVQTTGFASAAQKYHKIDGSSSLTNSGKGEAQSAACVASQDLLYRQCQETQQDEQLDTEQAVFSNSVRASPNVRQESDELKPSSSMKGTSQVNCFDVKKFSTDSSAFSLQAEMDQESTPSKKQNGVAPPHPRMQSARSSNQTKPLSPHLIHPDSPPTTNAIRTNAKDGDPKRKRLMDSVMEVKKPLPHLRGLSTSNTRATEEPSSVSMPLPTTPKKDDIYRPNINMDEEIATTQPILNIDGEIVADLCADTADASAVAQPTDDSAQETNEQIVYVPPHLGASSSRSKASAAESKSNTKMATRSQADQYGARRQNTKAISNELTFVPCAGTSTDFTTKRNNANLVCTPKDSAAPDRAESSIKKGKKPAREFGSVEYSSELVGWDGKMNQPPVGDEWYRRQPFIPQSQERLSVIEAWREEHAADPEENNRVIVNTSNLNFQTGEGLAGGDVNVLSPIDKMDHETRAPDDDFTQARRNQNAAEAIKHYEAKMAAKPKMVLSGIEGMTREEKRNLRRALIEEERTIKTLPNPHAPAANVYLRPAEFKDMGQVTKIYNHYINKTSFMLHLDPVEELYWRSRLQEAEDERNPFVVAIHMGERSCKHQGDIIRKKQENVVGFAVAADLGNKHTMYHSSVELELTVHTKFCRLGIGRTLLDRILAALSPDHNILECAPFLPRNGIEHWIGGGSRQAKAIIVNIHHADEEGDVVTWRKQWLARYDFRHVGSLPHVGFKKGKLEYMSTCVENECTILKEKWTDDLTKSISESDIDRMEV